MGLLNFLTADKAHEQPIEIEIGGKKYKMGRVTIDDLAALQARLRQEHVRAIIALQGEIQPTATYARALAHAACQDPSEDDLFGALESMPARAFLLYRAINRYCPTVTEKEIKEAWETGCREIAATLLAVSQVAQTIEEEDGDDATANPTDPVARGTGSSMRVFSAPSTATASKK